MSVAIEVARAEDEAPTELKRVLAELMLAESAALGALACFEVVGAQQMQEIGGFQACCTVGFAVLVNQQREADSGFFPEQRGIMLVSQADGCQVGAFGLEVLLVFAHLRDMLAAEYSSVVAEEDDDGGFRFPERAEADFGAGGIRQTDVGERGAQRRHKGESTTLSDTLIGRMILSSRVLFACGACQGTARVRRTFAGARQA